MEQLALNVTQAAQLLGIDRKTATALIHRGELPAFRIGTRWLVSRSKLEEWIERNADSGTEFRGVNQ